MLADNFLEKKSSKRTELKIMDSHRQVIKLPNSELVQLIRKNATEFDRFEGNIISTFGGQVPQSLLITSCNPGEGKTTSAAVIGASMAARGVNNVLLVDAHIRKPRLHRLFEYENSRGLADVILKEFSWRDAIRPYANSNLHILSAGKNSENPLLVFRSPRFASILEEWKEHYDCIIFDGPSYLGAPECGYIAPMFQGVLLVVACEQTRWQLASVVKSKIEAVNGKVLGSIMNRRKYYIPQILYGIL